jgi:hypothetical protein
MRQRPDGDPPADQQPLEAHLMKTKLESEDLECFLQDENMGLFTNAIGGVKLLVREEDAEQAAQILFAEDHG